MMSLPATALDITRLINIKDCIVLYKICFMKYIYVDKFCIFYQFFRVLLSVNIMDISIIKAMTKMVSTEYVSASGSQTWISLNKYEELRKEKLVQIKDHVILPLKLLNYTYRAQVKKNWCRELMIARGLVVREDGMIVARPLPKFFIDFKRTSWFWSFQLIIIEKFGKWASNYHTIFSYN